MNQDSRCMVLLLFLLFLRPVNAEFTSGPKNIAVVVGQKLEMRCQASSSSKEVIWILNSHEQEHLIYSSKTNITNNFTRFSVNIDRNGLVILQTNSAELRDAGVYECKTIKKDNHNSVTIVKTSAHAVILAEHSKCETNTNVSVNENKSVEFRCTVVYRGNWVPVMDWRKDGEERSFTTDSIEIETKINSFTSTLRLLAHAALNNTKYICKTYFKEYGGDINTTAINIPEYNHTWSSPPLNVIYGPRNVVVVPDKEWYRVGDVLSCSADANPRPSFVWKEATSGTQHYGQVFSIPEFMTQDGEHETNIVCAVNNSEGTDSKSILLKFQSVPDILTICSSLLGSACVLLLIWLFFVIRSRRNRDNLSDWCWRSCLMRTRHPDVIDIPIEDLNEPAPAECLVNAPEHPEYSTTRRNQGRRLPLPSPAVETDGIEYLRMSDDRRLVGENRLPLPGFEPVVYEDIDHTIPAIPPPPLPRRNQ